MRKPDPRFSPGKTVRMILVRLRVHGSSAKALQFPWKSLNGGFVALSCMGGFLVEVPFLKGDQRGPLF